MEQQTIQLRYIQLSFYNTEPYLSWFKSKQKREKQNTNQGFLITQGNSLSSQEPPVNMLYSAAGDQFKTNKTKQSNKKHFQRNSSSLQIYCLPKYITYYLPSLFHWVIDITIPKKLNLKKTEVEEEPGTWCIPLISVQRQRQRQRQVSLWVWGQLELHSDNQKPWV